jgi:C4-dicarboxylate-specific signal transduction histidine kinase
MVAVVCMKPKSPDAPALAPSAPAYASAVIRARTAGSAAGSAAGGAAGTAAAAACDAITTAVVAFDGNGRKVFANAAFERRFAGELADGADEAAFAQHFRVVQWNASPEAAAEPAAAEWQHKVSGLWYAVSRSAGRSGGQALHVLELADISQRVADEQQRSSRHEQLLFTSKVMSVGEMAATLAHELNQPIGSLLNFLNGCVMRLERGQIDPQELHGALVESRAQCERAAAIITRIRQFVRAREPRMAAVSLHEVCTTVIGTLDAEIKLHHVQVQLQVPTNLPPVQADRVMLEQVVHNLAKNAIDAMRTQRPPRRLLLRAAIGRDGMVDTSVQDSGPGVAEDARSHLFSPFFTTKADGLGIGLNICRSMIEFHGGTLYYDHPAAGGSRFAFTVPVHSSAGVQ